MAWRPIDRAQMEVRRLEPMRGYLGALATLDTFQFLRCLTWDSDAPVKRPLAVERKGIMRIIFASNAMISIELRRELGNTGHTGNFSIF